MLTLDALTDRVLEELAAAYGVRFLRQWENIRPEVMHRAWRRQLAMLTPQMVGWALRNLPEIPPNAIQFRALALRRPSECHPSLPEPRPPPPDKERLEKLLGRARSLQHRNPRQWAYDLRDREHRGERLTLAQRIMWRAAIPEGDQQQPCKPHES